MKVHLPPSALLSSPATALDTMSPLTRLWALRLLVPLGAHRQLLFEDGFQNELLGSALGLDAEQEDSAESSSLKDRLAALRRLHRSAERQRRACRLPQALELNLETLSATLGLTPLERQLLAFAVVLASDSLLEAVAGGLGYISTSTTYQVLAVLLDSDTASVRTALCASGTLASSGLLRFERCGQGELSSKLMLLSGDLADQLLHADAEPLELLRHTVLMAAPAELGPPDFAHLGELLDLLLRYLQLIIGEGRRGVNVLLHGAPGTGKTQLARVLAGQLGARLFEVTSEDSDGDPISGDRRLQAYRAAQCFIARQRALVLFDEAEDVFAPADGLFGRPRPVSHKAWLNRMLEGNAVPAIWITNAVADIDPAMVRRFDMVVAMPVPPRQQRERLLQQVCGDLVPGRSLHRLAELESLAPAVAARAAKVVRAVGDTLPTHRHPIALQALIRQTLQAQGHVIEPRQARGDSDALFDPAFLHADADLEALVMGMGRQGAGRLCLYGPPGSGKTAFAHWAAERLGVPLIARTASDLLSPWVGQSERNIASAFRTARSEGGLLLIDEVDALLRDRAKAGQAWEHSITAELLVQIEAFDGLLLLTTNLLDTLDDAALRRLDLHVRFDSLKPAQASALLARCCAVLGLGVPEAWVTHKVARIGPLTAGDFASVARRHRLQPFSRPDEFLSALERDKSRRTADRPPLAWLN